MTRSFPTLRSRLLAALALVPVLALGSTARAAEPGSRPTLAQLQLELASGDEPRVLRALAQLAKRKPAGGLAVLTAFVRAGQPDAQTDGAILALGSLGTREALPVLSELARHRRASARIAALTGIGALRGADTDALLVAGLRDSDAGVRGACARMLGERGTKSAVDVLFLALERGVPEAAPAIGRLGDAAAAARMHGLLGRLALQTVLAGYERFLARTDLDEATKLEIVARLGEVAGVAVKRFLEQQLSAGVAARSPRLAHALRESARRIPEPGAQKPAGVVP